MQFYFKKIKYTPALILFLLLFTQVSQAQQRIIYQEPFSNKNLAKNWDQINGKWTIENDTLSAQSNKEWAILISKKSLPKNYILSFSMIADPKAYLFELMTNLNDNHFLGILFNQLDKRVAIEDREFFPEGNAMGSYIHTKGHIGKMPKVNLVPQQIWIDWKVQKTGNQLFIWMNGEEMISLNDTTGIVKPGGRFGFAINGKATIKSVTLVKTRGSGSLPPLNFTGRPLVKPVFIFSE